MIQHKTFFCFSSFSGSIGSSEDLACKARTETEKRGVQRAGGAAQTFTQIATGLPHEEPGLN